MTVETFVVALAAFGIGFSKAGIGGGLGPLITVLMLVAFPPDTALALLLPLLIVGDVFSLTALWKRWDWRHAVLLLPGAVVGVAIGTYLVSSLPPRLFRIVLGVVVLAFVAYFLIRPRLNVTREYVLRRWHGWLAGSTAGFTSALAHSGGPPITVYLLLQKLEPVRFVATTALVFASVNLIKVPAYASVGLFDWDVQLRLWWAILFIPLGAWAGRWAVTRVSPAVFHHVMTGLLAVSGLFLIFDS